MASAQFRTLPARQPTPLSSKLPLSSNFRGFNCPFFSLAYQVNVLQKISGTGCLVIKKAVGITQATKHDNQNCRKSPIED
jgi:hypothetical protein